MFLKRTMFAAMIVAVGLFAGQSAMGVELLTNPNLDDDSFGVNQTPVGYSFFGGRWYGFFGGASSGARSYSAFGQNPFSGGPQGWGGGVYQDITAAIVATGPSFGDVLNFTQSGHFHSNNGWNTGSLVLEIRRFSSTGTAITSVATSGTNGPVVSGGMTPANFTPISRTQTVTYTPGFTYFAVFGSVVNAGSSQGVQFDTLSVQLDGAATTTDGVPEPASLGLFAMGLAGLGLFLWRRRRA